MHQTSGMAAVLLILIDLKEIQLEAARIVTGLPAYTPVQALYFETGWEILAHGRKKQKITF